MEELKCEYCEMVLDGEDEDGWKYYKGKKAAYSDFERLAARLYANSDGGAGMVFDHGDGDWDLIGEFSFCPFCGRELNGGE